MNNFLKKTFLALVLAVALVFPILQISSVYTAEPTVQERTLAFLTDVIMLDTSRYNVLLISHGEPLYPPDYVIQEEVHYELRHEESEVDATFIFENGAFSWCSIYYGKEPPFYTQTQPLNVIDAAKGLIERYQMYSGSSHFQEMIDVLSTIDKVESTTVTLGNMKLQIKVAGLLESFTWYYIYDSIEIKALSILFDKGAVWTFREHWGTYAIGSTTINVLEEEAINIAMKAATNTWKVNGVEIKDFTILDEHVRTELSMQARKPLTLYPHWRVDLSLDKVYPGGVSSISVGLWADTGEVRYCQASNFGVIVLPENSTTNPSSKENPTVPSAESLTETQTEPLTDSAMPPAEQSTGDSSGQTNFDPVLLLIGVVVVLAITTIVVKKKPKLLSFFEKRHYHT